MPATAEIFTEVAPTPAETSAKAANSMRQVGGEGKQADLNHVNDRIKEQISLLQGLRMVEDEFVTLAPPAASPDTSGDPPSPPPAYPNNEISEYSGKAGKNPVSNQHADYEAPPEPAKRGNISDDEVVEEEFSPTGISNAFRAARKRLGLNQRQAALLVGCSQTIIARLENPDFSPTSRTINTVAKGYGLKATLKLTPK